MFQSEGDLLNVSVINTVHERLVRGAVKFVIPVGWLSIPSVISLNLSLQCKTISRSFQIPPLLIVTCVQNRNSKFALLTNIWSVPTSLTFKISQTSESRNI